MKKIMKKALSLMLALIMMLSLAPMTALAGPGDYLYPEGDGLETPYSVTADAGQYFISIEAGYPAYVQLTEPGDVVVTGLFCYSLDTEDQVSYSIQASRFDYSPVESDVDGYAEYEIPGCESFIINNTSDYAINVVFMVSSTGGTSSNEGTMDNPKVLELQEVPGAVVAEDSVTLAAENEGYYYKIVAPASGKLGVSYISSDVEWQYRVDNITANKYGDTHWSDEDPVVAEELITVNKDDVIQIWVATYDPSSMFGVNPAGSVNVTVRFIEEEVIVVPGSVASAAIVTENGEEYTNTCNMTYYTYTATADGVLSLETAGLAGFTSITGRESISIDDYVAEDGVTKIQLAKDEVVVFWVLGTASTTKVEVAFEAGATLGKEEVKEDSDYEVSETPLTLGEKTYALGNVPYTVFEFYPTATGVYTITVLTEDTVMGDLGAVVLASRLNDSVVKETTIRVECKEVGPTWNIAVAGATNEATIKVEKVGEAVAGPGYPEYIGGWDLVSQEAYKYEGKVEDLKVVNIKDDVIDKAVLGSDSLYHLNSADGPVIFVDLNDSKIISLYDVFVNGGMKAAFYDEAGKIEYVDDYSSYFNFVYELADEETKLYPLTTDLMEMIQDVGNSKGKEWYDVTNQYGVKSGKEDAWMFCCYYNEGITTFKAPFKIWPTYVPVDPEEPVFDKDTMKELVDLNKTQPVAFYTTVGEDKYVTFTFAPNTLALVDGVEEYDFSVELVEDAKEIKNEKVTADNFVLRINFAYSGKLPAEATITIPVPEAYEGKTLYYYQIMEDGSLKYVCDAPVAGGVATVTQDHCSDYVLLTEKIVEAAPETAPVTGDSSNIALWVAVLGLGVVAIAGSVVMKKREF